MSLVFVKENSVPTYVAVSSDIDLQGRIDGISIVGSTVFTTDDGQWYIVEEDLSLSPYSLPFSVSGEITIGQVSQGSASLTEKWLMKTEYPEELGKISSSQGKYFPSVSSDFHFHVHNGNLWEVTTYNSAIPTNSQIGFGISVGSLGCHIGFTFTSSGDSLIDTFVNSVFSGGVVALPFNHNLDIETTPQTVLYKSPTVSQLGTQIRQVYLPGGKQHGGSTSPLSPEFIIPPLSKFYIRYTNLDGNDAIFNMIINFYEK